MGNMGKNSNFNSPLTITSSNLHITGVSTGPADAELVSRHVAVTQNGKTIHGSATRDLEWTTDPLAAGDFKAGEALAIATETHFVTGRPFFATETWAQIVTLQ